jgi:hypothetical protein
LEYFNSELASDADAGALGQQKTPLTLKPYFELKHSERAHRNIEIKRKFSEVASSLYSDIFNACLIKHVFLMKLLILMLKEN